MNVTLFLLIAIAGALGAVCRYVLDFAIVRRSSKVSDSVWGTWWVNVTGSLGLGVLVGFSLRHNVAFEYQLVVGGGFLGAYTTFSTWMYQTVRLVERGAWSSAMLNMFGSLASGGLAVAIGIALGHLFTLPFA